MSHREIGFTILALGAVGLFVFWKYKSAGAALPTADAGSSPDNSDNANASTLGDLQDGSGSAG